jgi:hypothetical protein
VNYLQGLASNCHSTDLFLQSSSDQRLGPPAPGWMQSPEDNSILTTSTEGENFKCHHLTWCEGTYWSILIYVNKGQDKTLASQEVIAGTTGKIILIGNHPHIFLYGSEKLLGKRKSTQIYSQKTTSDIRDPGQKKMCLII